VGGTKCRPRKNRSIKSVNLPKSQILVCLYSR